MKSLISINKKFMEINPRDLVAYIIENSKYVSGIELYANYNSDEEMKYMTDIAFECKKNNFHFQLHGNSSLPIEEQLLYFNKVEELYNLLRYKINVVLHPLESVEKTVEYINTIEESIDKNKITISLENLNDSGKEERLNKRKVIPIIANNCDVRMTYDMGHEMADFGDVIDIDDSIFDLVNNIHLHSRNNVYDEGNFDHKPIFNDDPYLGNVIKCVEFLLVKKYTGPVVFEYNIYMCHGNNLYERIKTYLESIDYISERLNSETLKNN